MWEAGGSRGWGSKALSARLVCEFRYACKSRRPTTGGGGGGPRGPLPSGWRGGLAPMRSSPVFV